MLALLVPNGHDGADGFGGGAQRCVCGFSKREFESGGNSL